MIEPAKKQQLELPQAEIDKIASIPDRFEALRNSLVYPALMRELQEHADQWPDHKSGDFFWVFEVDIEKSELVIGERPRKWLELLDAYEQRAKIVRIK